MPTAPGIEALVMVPGGVPARGHGRYHVSAAYHMFTSQDQSHGTFDFERQKKKNAKEKRCMGVGEMPGAPSTAWCGQCLLPRRPANTQRHRWRPRLACRVAWCVVRWCPAASTQQAAATVHVYKSTSTPLFLSSSHSLALLFLLHSSLPAVFRSSENSEPLSHGGRRRCKDGWRGVFARARYGYTVQKMLMPMLYPVVVVMSLFARTGNVFWPFNPVDVGPVVERPLVVLHSTCFTFFAMMLVHMYMATAWHHLGGWGSVRLRRQYAWFAPVVFWFITTAFFFHYINIPGVIGVHPTEKVVAQVSSSILLIFTVVLLGAVPLKLDEHQV